VTLVAYSPLGRGYLVGNFAKLDELPPDDIRQHSPRFQGANGEHNAQLVGRIRELSRRKGCSAPQLALAWVLAQDEHVVAIPGMKTREHLADNLGASKLTLSSGELAELRALLDGVSVQGERYPPPMMRVLGV